MSVVVPVRDCERYIAEALESIFAQSTLPGEVVVVDDGSTDGTSRVLDRYAESIRVVRQPPAGVAVARNRGVTESSRPLLASLDADDVWEPNALECRLARIDGPDAPDAVVGRMVQFVSPELGPAAVARFRFDPSPADVVMFGTMLVRRTAFERVGPLDPQYVTGANIDWVSRARAVGLRIVEVPDVVVHRRLHETNLGIIEGHRKDLDFVRIVRAHRRRHHPADPPSDTP